LVVQGNTVQFFVRVKIKSNFINTYVEKARCCFMMFLMKNCFSNRKLIQCFCSKELYAYCWTKAKNCMRTAEQKQRLVCLLLNKSKELYAYCLTKAKLICDVLQNHPNHRNQFYVNYDTYLVRFQTVKIVLV
jgi:hypothetical protein